MHVPQSACSSSFRSVMFVLSVPSQHGTPQNFTCKVSHQTVCLRDKPRSSPGRRPSRPRGLRRTASRPQCRGDTWSGTRGWRSSCGHTGRKETPARWPAAGPNSGSRLAGRREERGRVSYTCEGAVFSMMKIIRGYFFLCVCLCRHDRVVERIPTKESVPPAHDRGHGVGHLLLDLFPKRQTHRENKLLPDRRNGKNSVIIPKQRLKHSMSYEGKVKFA